MGYILRMPRLSDTMQEGELLKWLRKEGDAIEPGDLLAEVETDKATMEFECYEGGVLKKIVAKAGETLPVGGVMGIVASEEGENIDDLLKMAKEERSGKGPSTEPARGKEPAEAHMQTAARSFIPAQPQEPLSDKHHWIKASPLARALAEDKGVDLTKIQGTGPSGRIVKQDVEKALTGGSLPASFEIPKPTQAGEKLKLSMMRKAIIRTMALSKPGVPHYYLMIDLDAEPLESYRAKLKKAGKKITITSLLVKAAAKALEKHPDVNTVFQGDHLLKCAHADIGVAVDMGDEGLITPVLRHCEEKTLEKISSELTDLASRAREKKLKEEEYKGATFAISNLGMFGITNFTAVILPPAAAMLAVGRTREIPVVRNGKVTVGKELWMTLSCDHRAVDGAAGARFLQTLKEILENPKELK